MMKYNIGDIVHATIQFADTGKLAKRFLAIIDKNEAVSLYQGVNLTTKDKSFLQSAVYIFKDEKNKLRDNSYAKVDTLYMVDEQNIDYKKGSLSPADLELILAKKRQLKEKNKLITKYIDKQATKEIKGKPSHKENEIER